MDYKEITNCLACGKNIFKSDQYLDLGHQPLANQYLNPLKQETVKSQKSYPLAVRFCPNCSHSQLCVSVKPELMFSDYKYVSGTTQTLKNHFKELVKGFVDFRNFNKFMFREKGVDYYESKHVLDIGSNDGSLLQAFKERGFNIMGIEPSENLAYLANSKGNFTQAFFWDSNNSYKLSRKYDIITALNVLGHNDNPYDFLIGCKRVLEDSGVLVVEFPYIKNIILNNEFDQFYHEHVNEFTVKSFAALAERVGFTIYDIQEFPEIHGGSLRFKLHHHKGGSHTEKIFKFIQEEVRLGLDYREAYCGFFVRARKNLLNLRYQLFKLHDEGYKIFCYGASAKSSVLFNWKDFTNKAENPLKLISYLVDDNPLKQGLQAPGSGISIAHPDILSDTSGKIAVLLTAWNFKDEIIERIKKLRPDGMEDVIVTYVPEVSVTNLY